MELEVVHGRVSHSWRKESYMKRRVAFGKRVHAVQIRTLDMLYLNMIRNAWVCSF